MMYEMLTGETPFRGDNAMAVMAGHLQGRPKPIRKARPDVPPALEAVVLHAMRRVAANRYQRTAEILDDLDHLGTLDPVRYDLSPEPAIGGMAAAGSTKRLWAYAALIALAFIAVVAVVLIVSVLL
jgi:serine/threonine-protein kinase